MLLCRPRRNRKSPAIRDLVQEVRLHPADLIYPLFVREGEGIREPIRSLPGIERLTLDVLISEVERALEFGVRAVALFPVVPQEKKDAVASEALNPETLVLRAIRQLKEVFPEVCVIADVALDPFASHGHDGLVGESGEVLNDETVEVLVKMACLQAEAGVDMVAPSDMMDGRVRALREGLDGQGFKHVSIHAYTAKYASCFYAPFRDALSSAPQFGDKRGYQMNPANQREALLEAALDAAEGADVLMVKPALPYLDVLAKMRERTDLPLSAFQVSGEYAMIRAAAERGWLDMERAFYESVLSIKRAGADMVFTYAAPLLAQGLTTGVLG